MFELIDFLIVNPIVNILFVIYNFVGDFGIAIILFTFLIKILIWPLTKRQLDQTKAMRRMQPELAEIRKRCNGNKQLESMEMLNLYKKHNVKPMRSITTLLIQIPIFIALFSAIRVMVTPTPNDYVEKRAYAPVASMERIDNVINLQRPYLDYQNQLKDAKDKSKVKEVKYEFEPKLFGVVDLSVRAGFNSISSIIILIIALAAALFQYFMAKSQQPKKEKGKQSVWKKMVADAKAGKDPNQEDMSAMVSGQMTFMMPLMMLMIMVSLPGALVLYYFLSNVISVAQQRHVLNKVDDQLDDMADKEVLKELKKKNKLLEKLGVKDVKEGEVVDSKLENYAKKYKVEKNKKTGTTTRVLKASDLKEESRTYSKKSKSKKQTNQPDNG